MKKITIIGLFITTILILLTPIIPANEYHQIEKSQISSLKNNLQYLYIKINNLLDLIKKSIMDKDFLSKEKFILLRNLNKNRNQLIEQINNLEIHKNLPINIFNLIISILFAIIGTIIGIVFGPFIALIVTILTAPAIILAKLIEYIINIIFTIINPLY
jgi:hypothetical protein